MNRMEAARNAPTRSPALKLDVVPGEHCAGKHQARHDRGSPAIRRAALNPDGATGAERAERVHGPVIAKNTGRP